MPSILLRRRAWVLLFCLAAGLIYWTQAERRQRIEYVGTIGREDVGDSPTLRLRHLIMPEHLAPSYEWVAQTQTMLERGDWRVRQVRTENAPHGRPEHAASPYRWWLAAVAALHGPEEGSWAAALEFAALWADPLLHLLLLATLGWYVARHFGAGPAAVAVGGLVLLFPLGAAFLAGVPEDFALVLALAPWMLLPLLVAYRGPPRNDAVGGPQQGRGGYAAAGVAAGVVLWLNVTIAVPLLLGLLLGGLLAAWIGRRTDAGSEAAPGWRRWGVAAAATVLVGYLIEYFPSHLGDGELRAVHPLYGLLCLGIGEILAQLTAWIASPDRGRSAREHALLLLGLAAAATVPLAMWRTGNIGFLNADLLSFRLTKQIDGVMAPNLLDWVVRDGFSVALAATLIPLGLLVGVLIAALHRQLPAADRQALALTLGPVVVAVGLALFHLRWWQLVGLLGLLAVIVLVAVLPRCGWSRSLRAGLAAAGALALSLGLSQLLPARTGAAAKVLSLPEVEALVERDLAHALARRVGPDGPANVLAPPGVTTTLNYYGGLPGLATLSWENKDGLSVALRIVISTSREEAHALVLSRGVTHIVMPSWDPFFETYTRAASVQTNELFLQSLRRWVVPMWLRPVPYQLPTIGGFENQAVTVFEVVEEQDPPVAMSRVTEYFIEMGEMDAARAAGDALRRYPADFSALVARAQLEAALTDAAAFSATLETLLQRLNARGDRLLPWDRRVSLAIVLARGKRLDLARVQAERCLEQVTEARLRMLTPYSLFHFQILLRAVERPISDPTLQALALDLLPPELRRQL